MSFLPFVDISVPTGLIPYACPFVSVCHYCARYGGWLWTGNYGGATMEGDYGGQLWRGDYGGATMEGDYGGVTMEGNYGGWLWRETMEGDNGGRLWRATMEGWLEGRLWRVTMERRLWRDDYGGATMEGRLWRGDYGGWLWRATMEGNYGGQLWRGDYRGRLWRVTMEGDYGGWLWRGLTMEVLDWRVTMEGWLWRVTMEGHLWRGDHGGETMEALDYGRTTIEGLDYAGRLWRGLTMEGQLWRKEIICFSLVIFQRLSAILEKYSDEHFRWKFETAINWIWNLEILSFPMMYDSHSPSQWYHLVNFWSLYHGLYGGWLWRGNYGGTTMEGDYGGQLWRGDYGGATMEGKLWRRLTMEGQLSRGLTMEGDYEGAWLWRGNYGGRKSSAFLLVIFQRLSAILEKYSDEHFRWKFETAINWIWNLEILSFSMMYDSHSPSQWYHLVNFWSLYHGLRVFPMDGCYLSVKQQLITARGQRNKLARF